MGNKCMPRKKASQKCKNGSVQIKLLQKGYCLGGDIAKGTFSNVLSATYAADTGECVRLACKVVNTEKAPRDFMQLFNRELDVITKIRHPHIIEFHSILNQGPNFYIFMRHAENGDLLNFINAHGLIEEPLMKKWFSQLVEVLRYLHSKEIAHRDLKCENILISRQLDVKLADFGIARYCKDSNNMQVFSRTYCGTVAYTAPEVLEGLPYDPKLADLWSLGVVLFIMLNVKFPFDDSSLATMLAAQHGKQIAYAEDVEEWISEDAKSIVNGLLEPDLGSRWSLARIATSNWLRGYPITEDDPEDGDITKQIKCEPQNSKDGSFFNGCCGWLARHKQEKPIETIFGPIPIAEWISQIEMNSLPEPDEATTMPLEIQSNPAKLKWRMLCIRRYRKNRYRRMKQRRRFPRRYRPRRIRK